MSSSAVLGQYLWHELLTTDPAAGAGFYSRVLGWKVRPWEGNADYFMLATAKGPVGGARVLGKDALADKAGPNWLTYVGVPDITAALAAVEANGGRIIHPVTAVPGEGGLYAVITDPQRATIGLYQPGANRSGGDAAPMAGPVVWHELNTEDPEAALRFYKAIFGWELVTTHDMGGDVGTYYLFGVGSTQGGGMFTRARQVAPTWPRWLVYLDVPDVTAAAAAAVAAGGKVLHGPYAVPGGSWMAQLADSHGVVVAVHGPQVAVKLKTKAKAKAAPNAKTAPKPKTASKPKTKAKAKTKTAPARKAAAEGKKVKKGKRPVKRKAAAKPKAKTKAKAKRAVAKGKARPAARAKARKRARRGK